MISSKRIKGALLVAVFAISTVLLVKGLNFFNTTQSKRIQAADNTVIVDSAFDGSLHIVEGITSSEPGILRFSIVSSGQPLSLLIDGLQFGHEIYIGNRLVSQNIGAGDSQYDGSYKYKAFDLAGSLTANSSVSIEITGEGVSRLKLILAETSVLRESLEARTICYSFMLMSLILFTLTSLFLYCSNKHSGFFLLFVGIGVVSIVKSVNLGELSVLAKSFGITYQQYGWIDAATSAVNLILPFFVMARLFDLYPKSKWRWVVLAAAGLATALTLVLGAQSFFYLWYARFVYFTSVALSIYGCMQNKRFSGVVMLNNILYSSCTFYATFVRSGAFRYGLLDFYLNTAYLGALIYLCVFLAVYIGYSFDKLRDLEEQKKRFERLSLLRGISHDLRLPLSVIKMNNQMLKMYPMDAEERSECVRLSIDAVCELESMTANINSYLMLEDPDRGTACSSVKRSFEKIREHYASFHKATGVRFRAEWEGEDCGLPVTELLLDRLLYNLVDNAFKYNRTNGTVSLICRTDEKNFFLSVADTGIGMDPETVKVVFTPFYRLDKSRSKEGLGLGLSVVQGITDSLGGKIALQSAVGSGTRIDVTIPLRK
ncbi:MAG: HAMP domain-containing sensor histidine kinase [Eubacteriales bacterium]|nr:HAMP domain-containing sensor histidine kinase [Eubacteriales bacterium]